MAVGSAIDHASLGTQLHSIAVFEVKLDRADCLVISGILTFWELESLLLVVNLRTSEGRIHISHSLIM